MYSSRPMDSTRHADSLKGISCSVKSSSRVCCASALCSSNMSGTPQLLGKIIRGESLPQSVLYLGALTHSRVRFINGSNERLYQDGQLRSLNLRLRQNWSCGCSSATVYCDL